MSPVRELTESKENLDLGSLGTELNWDAERCGVGRASSFANVNGETPALLSSTSFRGALVISRRYAESGSNRRVANMRHTFTKPAE